MNIGVKVSKPGYSVTAPDKEPAPGKHTETATKSMVAGLSLAFIEGAKSQIERYKEAYKRCHTNAAAGSILCLHETATLLEDLDTLQRYVEKCGETHELNKIIRDMRNHVRHDLRENIDDIKNKGRRDRTRKLGVHPNLLVSIGFSEDAIKMGETILTLDEAAEYIQWASDILTGIMKDEIKAGRVSGASIA